MNLHLTLGLENKHHNKPFCFKGVGLGMTEYASFYKQGYGRLRAYLNSSLKDYC